MYRRGLRAGQASASLLAESDYSSEGEAAVHGQQLSTAEAGRAGSKPDGSLPDTTVSGQAAEQALHDWAAPQYSGRLPLPTVPE